jgi:uncharacterized protein (UPF0548 family)
MTTKKQRQKQMRGFFAALRMTVVEVKTTGLFRSTMCLRTSTRWGVIGSGAMTVSANATEAARESQMYQQAKVAVVGASDVVLDDVVLRALKPGRRWNIEVWGGDG